MNKPQLFPAHITPATWEKLEALIQEMKRPGEPTQEGANPLSLLDLPVIWHHIQSCTTCQNKLREFIPKDEEGTILKELENAGKKEAK